ncbi:DUF58 domain-containing protein [Gilvimarinus polysaccharolyticus]|uniref:DUF58 domain-containing protein n=1 Tax=Gilvimarinus polysaccharolyticus TaxID=863921 RepID=UPI000673B23C|nr:DUF58 domain-containing protein [Gilvimarinus polysaccharolyticus]
MTSSIFSKRAEAWFWRWAKRRITPQKSVVLRHRAIYVLPSRAGLGFFFAVSLLWLLGTNYENNLVLAASFFLISLFIVAIIHAFRNLAGLQLTALAAVPVFAGERLVMPVRIQAKGRARAGQLQLACDTEHSVLTDVAAGGETQVALSVQTLRRGWFTPERILVKSYFPLGLVRTWSWVRFDVNLLVYPHPIPVAAPPLLNRSHGEKQSLIARGDDFEGFKRYQPGAPLAHIAWKLYARGAGLQVKQYADVALDDLWLDFRALSGEREARLSGLCYLALDWHRAGRTFGLRLLDHCIEPASGQTHLSQVLRALALFELESTPR